MPFTVRDLIRDQRKPVVVKLAATAQAAVDLMIEYDFSQLPVVDDDSRPTGMVTSDSILRAHSSLNLPLGKLRVRDAMSKKPREFEASDDLFEMLEDVMDSEAVFIVDGDGRLTGIVTSYDTSEYFRRRAEDLMLCEDIEMTLREHIRAAYVGPSGLDDEALAAAVSELVRERGGLRGKFKGALKKYASEKAQGPLDEAAANAAFDTVFASTFAGTKFEDLNLSDYVHMIAHGDRWAEHFYKIFGVEADALKHMLDGVRGARNTLAHFRGEITSTQRNHLRFCTEWLARHPAPPAPNSHTAGKTDAASAAAPPAVPPERTAEALDRAQAEDFSAEDSRYTPLATYLQSQPGERVELTFIEIETIIAGKLPAYARKHPSWWANDSMTHPQSRQWLQAGWRMLTLSITDEKVSFYRPTERSQAYIAFFSELMVELNKASPGLFASAPPNGSNWLNVRYVSHAGEKIGLLAFTFAHRNRFRAELYIDSGDRERNKSLFDALLARRVEIEAQLGEVGWERLNHRRASRVAVYRAGSIEEPPKKLAALRAWGVEHIIRLNAVVLPLLHALPRAGETTNGQGVHVP